MGIAKKGLVGQMLSGTIWMVCARWGMKFIGLVSTAIIARILSPNDFGVIAIALVVLGFLETIAYVGVDLAIIQNKSGSNDLYDCAWTVQVIQGIAIGAIIFAIAPLAGVWFSDSRVVDVIYLLALRPVVSGFQNIGLVLLRKDLAFSKDFLFQVGSKAINFFVLVSAAYFIRNYWALAIAMTTASLVEVVLSYLMHPYRPRFNMHYWRELFGFSSWLIVARLGGFLGKKIDELIIGRELGTTAMGAYHVSSELSTMPNNELVMPIRRALFPSLAQAKRAGDIEFERLLAFSFSLIAILVFPIGIGLASIAPEFVLLFLGEKWLSAIPLVEILALYGIVSALFLGLEIPLWVSGKVKLSAGIAWCEIFFLGPLLIVLVKYGGVEGVALSRLLASALVLPLAIHLVAKSCVLSVWVFYRSCARPFLAALIMGFIARPIIIAFGLEGGFALLYQIVLSSILYVSMLLILWTVWGRPDGVERRCVDVFLK